MTDRDKANLSRHTSTKLAAILFADIAGYTALMQEDEEGALLRLNRFEELLEKYAPEYGGQIVQYFGDGCVMAFGVSKDAVSCAMRL
jgi:adenylate cyclase